MTWDRAKIAKRQLRRSDVRGSVARLHNRDCTKHVSTARSAGFQVGLEEKKGHSRSWLTSAVYVTAGVNEIRSPAPSARSLRDKSSQLSGHRLDPCVTLLPVIPCHCRARRWEGASDDGEYRSVRYVRAMQKCVDRRAGTTSMRLNESATCVCSQASYSEDQLAGKWRATVTAARPREARDCEWSNERVRERGGRWSTPRRALLPGAFNSGQEYPRLFRRTLSARARL